MNGEPMSGRKLLYVVNIPRFFISHRLPLALAARDAGYEVHVATSDHDGPNLDRIREAGLQLHPIPLAQHGRRPLDEIRTLSALLRLYRRLDPDIVHHVTIKPVLYGGLAARLTGRRAVVAAMSGLGRTFRDETGGTRRPGRILLAVMRRALPPTTTHVLVQNEDDLAVLLDLELTRPDRSSVIRGSGVDLASFSPQPAPSGRPVVLYAGRLMWQKGLGAFVAAARSLGEAARFAVAGYSEDGSPDAVPVAQVEEWAREGTVEWLGPRDDMPRVLNDAAIVVLPTVYGEGVPKTLIEAAACGRPIVTTDTPGCRDICVDGVNGLLVPPGDQQALERAIGRLVHDPELRHRMGVEGRRIAEQSFGIDQVNARTLAIYRALLGTAPG
jgi:glycosyltransferase involved in cell wall biosynthesis